MIANNIEMKHEFSYGGATMRIYHAKKGEGLYWHSHQYNHATFCSSGSCLLTENDKELIIDKDSQPVNLIAGRMHQIVALEDGTVFVNVFADGKY